MNSPKQGDRRNDEETLAGILREIIDRQRDGEHPQVEEFLSRFPELAERIESHFRTMEMLEEFREAGLQQDRLSQLSNLLGEAISSLPLLVQRVIFLKHFEKRNWQEIARILGNSEEGLRRRYARAVRELMQRCSTAPER